MATRFYFPEGTPAAVSPTLQSYTHSTALRRQLVATTPSGTTLTLTAITPDGADHLVAGDCFHRQYVSGLMVAGKVFTSGDTLKLVMQALEANAGNNQIVQVFVSIVDSAGTTVRATIRSKVAPNASEIPTTPAASRFLNTTLSGSYTTVANDRIVVEISCTGTPTGAGGTQGHNCSFKWGDNGSGDFAESDGSTSTVSNPWIEFATSDLFATPVLVTPGVASLALTAFAPTASVTNHKLVTPGVATLSLTALAPTVTASAGGGASVTPGIATLILTAFAPAVSTPRLVTPGTASLIISAQTPIVTLNIRVTPGIGTLVLSAKIPSVAISDNKIVVPGIGTLTLSAQTPTITATAHKVVIPGIGVLTLTSFAPSVALGGNLTVIPGIASLFLTGFAPDVIVPAEQAAPRGGASSPTQKSVSPDSYYVRASNGLIKIKRFLYPPLDKG